MKEDNNNVRTIIDKLKEHNPVITKRGESYIFDLPEGNRFRVQIYYTPWIWTLYSVYLYNTVTTGGANLIAKETKFDASRKLGKELFGLAEANYKTQERNLKNKSISKLV